MRYFIGDVRDADAPAAGAATASTSSIHAAALKQVPTAEYNPFECIKTNVLGAENVIDGRHRQRACEKVIALSTDKAANPINLYGATKLASDKLFVAANNYRRRPRHALRGRALRQRGGLARLGRAVLPQPDRAERQGSCRSPIARMTRFWITLEQGVEFVLDEPSSGCTAARSSCPRSPRCASPTWPRRSRPACRTSIVGIRPGEKLHEIMCPADDCT